MKCIQRVSKSLAEYLMAMNSLNSVIQELLKTDWISCHSLGYKHLCLSESYNLCVFSKVLRYNVRFFKTVCVIGISHQLLQLPFSYMPKWNKTVVYSLSTSNMVQGILYRVSWRSVLKALAVTALEIDKKTKFVRLQIG